MRRSQCLPLLRGGAERSEAERFRRAAAAGMTSQALRAQPLSQGGAKGVRRSQCLPLLRGGAERSEAERFRRAAGGASPLRKGSQGVYRNFLLQFLQKEKKSTLFFLLQFLQKEKEGTLFWQFMGRMM